MSAHIYVSDECFGGATIGCSEDDPVIWIGTRDESVSLRLGDANLDALIAAAQAAKVMLLEQSA